MPLQRFGSVTVRDLKHLIGVPEYLIIVLICISLMAHNTETSFHMLISHLYVSWDVC